ncbi:TPA: hypothetical protein N0F65_001212 [Lagenidium giganteum]|uniref:ZNF598/HEL2 PAH domain-containing protein n=1 Tax=Lagenidium giganteum TaxID=4803 RepID=A0AAV2Z2W0_9STRA|nr:TPA: hypothetical protein N0F65_001212 [Lagenidium giganteum]
MTADAPAARSNTPETDASAGDNFELSPYHPYHLLLPIDHVPEVPGTVECLFDDDAVKMQKTILKVVKKLLQKDKFKIEDFKINAKLYGNSFMEPHEYVEYLATDFGGIRALQIVPSLLLIQPDHLKQSSLLVAAQNYRVRNLAKLENAIARAPKPSETVAGTSKPVTHEVPVMPVVPVAPVAPTIPDAPQAIEAPTSAVAVAAPVVAPVVAATLIAACSTSNEETTNRSNPSANADSTTDIPAVSLEQTPSQDDINHVGVKTSGSAHIRDHLSEVSGTVEPASVQQLPRLSEPIAFSEQTYGVAELSIAGTSAPPASLTATGNLFGESFSEEPVSTPSPAEVAMSQSSVDVTDASVGSTSSEATPSIDIADFAADGNLFGDATSGDSTSPGVNLFGEALELNSGNLATSSTGVSQPMMAGTSTTPEPSTASGPAAPAFGRTSLFGFAAGAATDSDSDSDFSD